MVAWMDNRDQKTKNKIKIVSKIPSICNLRPYLMCINAHTYTYNITPNYISNNDDDDDP